MYKYVDEEKRLPFFCYANLTGDREADGQADRHAAVP